MKKYLFPKLLFYLILGGLTIVNLLFFASAAVAQNSQQAWRWANPAPHGNMLNSIAVGNGRFVAVGELGTIASSTDGMNWVLSTRVTSNYLSSVVWNGSLFVAVGLKGTVVTSSDGINWTIPQWPTTQDLMSVCTGNGWLVAVGFLGTVITSQDGVTWATQNSQTNDHLNVCFWNGTQFVAPGRWETATWNGVSGTPWTAANSATGGYIFSVASNGAQTRYIAGVMVDTHPTKPMLASSMDGISWDQSIMASDLDPSLEHEYIFGVAWGNGRYVAIFTNGAMATSTDGVQWSLAPQPVTSCRIDAIAWGNGKFVAVGSGGTVLISSDGLNWTFPSQIPVVTANNLYGVNYVGSRFIVAGNQGTLLTSRNGKDWSSAASGTTSALVKTAYGNGNFVAVGVDGAIITSTDTRNWTVAAPVTTDHLMSVAWGGGTFVGVGFNGTVVTSTNGGVSWSKQRLLNNWGDPPTLLDVTWGSTNGGNRFIAVGLKGCIWTSLDGSQWVPAFRNAEIGTALIDLYSVAWKPGTYEFVAVGYQAAGSIQVPPDGRATWTTGAGIDDVCQAVIWNTVEAKFMAACRYGSIVTSVDGNNWSRQEWFTHNDLNGLASGNGQSVMVGSFGTILYGADLIFKDGFDDF